MKRGGLGRAAALAAAIFGSIAVAGGTVAAQDVDLEALENVPALITADELTYDETNGLVVAAGNVEISQSDRVLLADKVTYDINADVVTAAGNATLIQPGGDTVSAELVELTGAPNEGFIRDLRHMLADTPRPPAAQIGRAT